MVPEPPELSVIIVSYNTCALTLQCVGAALSQEGPSLQVIVVDNASSDGSTDEIEKTYPQVLLLAQSSNLGFARACNLAADLAEGRLLLLLNPDAIPMPGAFAAIVDFARRWPHAMIWGGRSLYSDGRLNPRSCAGRPTLWSVITGAAGLAALRPHSVLLNPEALPGWKRDDERHVDIVIGSFFLIGRSDWVRLGGFDPSYFMYGEEVDLCLRAVRLGARPAITPSAEVVHDEGSSQPLAPRTSQILAARIRYLRRHLPSSQRALAIWAIRLGIVLRLAGYAGTSLFPRQRSHFRRLKQVWMGRELWWSGYPDTRDVVGSKIDTG